MGSIHHRSNIIIQLESFKIKDDRVVGIKRKKRKKKEEEREKKNRGKKDLLIRKRSYHRPPVQSTCKCTLDNQFE